MNDYTQRTIEALKHMHSIKAVTQEFVRGGAEADAVLARSIAHLEAHPLDDGAHGGPANAAGYVANLMA